MGKRGVPTLLLAFLFAASLPAQTRTLRVLFLGNSLTAGNDVPALVQAMAQLQGANLEYTAIAPGGYAIEDHWVDGNQRLLETGRFDVLILQQGPSTLAASQSHLREWTITWAAQARRFGTRPALYMIWPVRTQANGFELVSLSYRNAATAADAAVFPAGEAWERALRVNPAIGLYQGDDLHATPAGSFLAAMVIARGLVGLDPARVPAGVRGVTVPAATLATFRDVVESMPPSTLSGLAADEMPAPTTPAPATGPTAPAPVPPAPVATSAGGGGGAPSLWFPVAILAVGLARRLQRRRFFRA